MFSTAHTKIQLSSYSFEGNNVRTFETTFELNI